MNRQGPIRDQKEKISHAEAGALGKLFLEGETIEGLVNLQPLIAVIGWKPKYKMDEVVQMMVQAAIEADE